MKTIFSHLNKFLCCAILCVMVCFSCVLTSNNFVYAESTEPDTEETQEVNYSIFIHKPTYSIYFDDQIYFVDEYDNYFKIFDTKSKEFSSTIIDLSEEFEGYSKIDSKQILDAAFDNGYLALLAINSDNKMSITIINIKTFKIVTQITNDSITEIHTKLSIKLIDNELAIALTSTKISPTCLPIVIFASIDSDTDQLTVNSDQIFHLNLKNDKITSTLLKTLIIKQPTYTGYYLIFIYEEIVDSKIITSVSYSPISSKSSLSDITSITSLAVESDAEEIKNIDGNVKSINLMEINGENYLLTTHTDLITETSYSHLYQFDVYRNNSEDKIIDTDIHFNNTINNYILTNENYVTYADQDAQKITFVNISNQGLNKEDAENPKIEIEYKDEENFVYQTTNTKTEIYERPWSAKPLTTIDENIDIIFIGIGKINTISEEKLTISDYNYCLYTFDGTNYLGYIKVSDLTDKSKINIEDYPYPVFKVVPNTNLYSLPTKVTGDKITSTLNSYVVEKIRDNSRVEILDAICEYTSCGETYLKVKVNGINVGYIEKSTITPPSDRINFVITNCSVKEDLTKVFIDPDKNSTVIYLLEKGYRVRINGERNTRTGYTYITFNDEYGNEFSGYIITDYLTTDSWSTLQIIGLVLIAITLGLLILILIFKRKKIGDDGQKYESNKKENYLDRNDNDNDINAKE